MATVVGKWLLNPHLDRGAIKQRQHLALQTPDNEQTR
eukprot:CAMPEP_0181402438 /NCGR_PEP_ID=MMETSP1110-20121109/3175_1 /TAXON_ID=174948 /ORGANISM="Symbiodinium sp., Strain CCMP421" /LENGTH=36 /DNA_ID= /DNA_START= /DNA_END= /DNA_ORIENTATION=